MSKPSTKIKNWTPEELVLLYSSRTILTPEIQNKLLSLLSLNLNWQWIKKTSIAHGVVPLLHHTLSNNIFSNVPPDVLQWLRKMHIENLVRNLRVQDEMSHIFQLLKKKSIIAVPFKGIDLARDVYKDISYRQVTDIDLIIRTKDVSHTIELLTLSGYDLLRKMNSGNPENGVPFAGFYNADRKIFIDVQWENQDYSFYNGYQQNELWDRVVKNSNNGPNRWRLASVDLFMLLCLHGNKHQWSHLKWLCDVAEFLRHTKNVDWDWIIKNAGYNGITRILSICLILTKDMMFCHSLEEVLDSIRPDAMSRFLSSQIAKGYFLKDFYSIPKTNGVVKKLFNEEMLYHFRSRDRSKDKLKIAKMYFQSITKPNKRDKIVCLPKQLSFFYYLIRFFRLLYKYSYKLAILVVYRFFIKK